jgi:hypothetical protein
MSDVAGDTFQCYLFAHQVGVGLQVSFGLVFRHQKVLQDFVYLRGSKGNRCGIRVFLHAEMIFYVRENKLYRSNWPGPKERAAK